MSSPSIRVGGVEFGAVADLSRAGVGAKEGLELRNGRNGAAGSLLGRFFRKSRQPRGKVEERPSSSSRVAEAPAEFLPIPRPLEPCEVDEPVMSPRPEASGQEESRSLQEHLRAAEMHKGLSPTSPIASFEHFVLESLTKKHRRRPPVDLASTVEAIRREGSSASPQDKGDIAPLEERWRDSKNMDREEDSAELEREEAAELERDELISRLQSAPSEEQAELRQTLVLNGSDWDEDFREASQELSSSLQRSRLSQAANSFKLPELQELRSSQALQGLESELQTPSVGPVLSSAHDRQESLAEEDLVTSGQESEEVSKASWRMVEGGAGLDSHREGSIGVGSPGSLQVDKKSSRGLGLFDTSGSSDPLVDRKAEDGVRQFSRTLGLQHSGTEVRGSAHWQTP